MVLASVASSAINPKQRARLQAETISSVINWPQILISSFWMIGERHFDRGSPFSRWSKRIGSRLDWCCSNAWKLPFSSSWPRNAMFCFPQKQRLPQFLPGFGNVSQQSHYIGLICISQCLSWPHYVLQRNCLQLRVVRCVVLTYCDWQAPLSHCSSLVTTSSQVFYP